jgi:hypothetical protein
MGAQIAHPSMEDTPQRDGESARARWRGRIGGDRATWWALLGALLLALLYGHITVMHLTGGIAGGKYNGYENVWNDYWLRTALLHLHQNPFYSTYVEYPTGVSLRFHTLNPLGGLIALPLWPLIGPIATMNVKFLLAIVGSTFFAYLLLRDLTQSPLAAFAGAVVYCFANTRMIDYYTTAEENYLMGSALLPLYIFFLLRAAERPRWWRDGAAATLLLFALCLTDWQFTLFAVLFTALYFLLAAGLGRSVRAASQLLLRFAVIGGIWAAVVFVPLLLPMIREAKASPWLSVGEESTNYARSLEQLFNIGADNPGYLVLAVTLVGLLLILRRADAARDRRMVISWAGIALVALVIALGPRLEIRPLTPTRIPLPYTLIARLPVLNIGRKPQEYYGSLAMLAFGVLFAFALRACIPYVRRCLAWCVSTRPRLRWIERAGVPSLTVILLAITVAPFFVQASTPEVHPLNVPAFYRDVLAKDPGQYAILEVPIFPSKRGQYGGTYQAFQITHGKARFGASISRDHNNESPTLFARHATLFRDFFYLEDLNTIEQYRPTKRPDFLATPNYDEMAVPLLNYYHVRYIVLYLDALLDQRKIDSPDPHLVLDIEERLVHQVLGADAHPVFQDAVTEIYRVPDAPPLAQPVFIDTGNSGWYAPEVNAEKIPYRWADIREDKTPELLLFNLSQQSQRMRVQFTAFNYKSPRTIDIAINGYAADHFTLAPDERKDVTLDLDIPPGMNRLTLTSPEPPMLVQPDPKFGRDTRELSFALQQVRLERIG